MRQDRLRPFSEKIISETLYIKEINHSIDTLVSHTQSQAQAVYSRLGQQLKEAAKQTIESGGVSISEQANLASKISEAVQDVSNKLAKEICLETQQVLDLALKELHHFYNPLSWVLATNLCDLGADIEIFHSANTASHLVMESCDDLSEEQLGCPNFSLSCSSETFIFEDEPSGAGTITGLTIGFLLGGPFGAAIGGAIGVAVGAGVRNSNCRERYSSKVMAEIEDQLSLIGASQTIENYVSEAFSSLREQQSSLTKEINSALETIHNRLAELNGQYEARVEKLDQVLIEVRRIIESTQNFSEQLGIVV
jgi:hypothetical protein